ncbi:hypothetical protein Aduo_012475 [Ancylostoma duodenale]
MQSFANGRQVTFVMDNAPYHSRVIERIPCASSRRDENVAYLRSKGVEVANDHTNAELLEGLEMYLQSRGGVSTCCSYAMETICAEHGRATVSLLLQSNRTLLEPAQAPPQQARETLGQD